MILTSIDEAAHHLKQNKVVAIPTETVYGLAANAFSEEAVQSIYDLKKRPRNNPLILHIANRNRLDNLAAFVPEKARLLADVFWPGPLTLVLEKKETIPSWITSGKKTVAIRVPDQSLTLELLQKLDFPLAAPSANLFGETSPTQPEHVVSAFGEKVPVLDGGICQKGLESTILGFDGEDVILYRHGPITLENLEKLVGKIHVKTSNQTAPEAPGMLAKHYAPKTEFYLTNDLKKLQKVFENRKIGILHFSQTFSTPSIVHQEVLSSTKDLDEAAHNLYACIRRLDESGADILIGEYVPEKGIGKAINDRLRRAATK